MDAFIGRQPNGRFYRFSLVSDCITHYNMTEDDYVDYCAEEARKKARRELEHAAKPFSTAFSLYDYDEVECGEIIQMLLDMTEPYDGEMIETMI